MKVKKITTDDYAVAVETEEGRVKSIKMVFNKLLSAADPEEAALIREASSMVNSFLGTQFVTDMMNIMASATIAEAKLQQANMVAHAIGGIGNKSGTIGGMYQMKKCPSCQAVVPSKTKICVCGHTWKE